MSEAAFPASAERRALEVVRDYLSLLKLRIVLLLDAVAVGAMMAAAHGWPKPLAVLGVVLGGTLAAGGAHAINCWFDRDIDAEMSRTRRRPIPAGRIPGWHALVMGIVLNVLAVAVLATLANLAAALLALLGTLIYVFVYTIWLKRSTPQNIVIGGAAGAIPPLVGWAAVTGGVDLTALSLFLLIFFWTPPHFWALAQIIRRDYEHAHVPMLPAVAGDAATKRQSLVYAVLTLGVSVVPFLTHAVNVVYLAGALVLGVGLVAACVMDLAAAGWTSRVFRYSLVYMAGVFLLLAIGSFPL